MKMFVTFLVYLFLTGCVTSQGIVDPIQVTTIPQRLAPPPTLTQSCDERNWRQWNTVKDILSELLYTKHLLNLCATKHEALADWAKTNNIK